jgi:glyoxylase-like metal-dependent hydrolase (beta-lactamase superfamily II)
MTTDKPIKLEKIDEGIYSVETYYLDREKFAGCYLLESNGEAAVIETNTNYAVPMILGGLEQTGIKKEQVKYVILTHIHLDHAGGAGELMERLPNATLAVHPRGR